MQVKKKEREKLFFLDTTYKCDAVTRSRGQRPGAGLPTGIFIRPVGAADGARRAVHDVIAAG